MLLQQLERHDVEGTLVRAREHDGGRRAVQVRAQPVGRRDAPPVTRIQPGEPVLRHRRAEVVADAPLVLEDLGAKTSW